MLGDEAAYTVLSKSIKISLQVHLKLVISRDNFS